MDFRQYNPALGRFNAVDRLTELAPEITPYHFGFNNPTFWSDPTGLFETRAAAMAHIKQNGISEANVSYNSSYGLWQINNNAILFG